MRREKEGKEKGKMGKRRWNGGWKVTRNRGGKACRRDGQE